MELNEILRQFERTPGKFPQAAVDEAVARHEEITPALLQILEETVERPAELDDNYMAHQFAMYLLAQFRETKACPWVLRIAALPSEHLTRLLGNMVNEDLGRILATLSGGDATGIQALVENEAAHYSARVAALDGLVTMVATQQKSREEILEYFGELLRSKLKRDPDEYLWGALVCSVCDLYPAELVDEIERAYDDELVYPGYVEFEDVERQLEVGKESTLSDLAKNPHYRMIVDASDEMRGWACGHDDPPPQFPEYKAFVPEPVKHAAPKVGRNDPCPCGSGKKYKKCHGA